MVVIGFILRWREAGPAEVGQGAASPEGRAVLGAKSVAFRGLWWCRGTLRTRWVGL